MWGHSIMLPQRQRQEDTALNTVVCKTNQIRHELAKGIHPTALVATLAGSKGWIQRRPSAAPGHSLRRSWRAVANERRSWNTKWA